jgi:hypothetical protein
MSVINVSQVKIHVLKLFGALIDLSGQNSAPAPQRDDFRSQLWTNLFRN